MKSIQSFVNEILHGNCVTTLPFLPDQSVDFVLTDPPYLVDYKPRDGRRCEGDVTHEWLKPSFAEIYRVLKPDAFCVTFYGWPQIALFMQVWMDCGFRPVSHLTWIKSYSSREGYTHSYHEVGFVLAKGKPRRPGKAISDVLPWDYTGDRYHPNEKPVIALTPIIRSFTRPGDIILDPFAGSGTSGVAAKKEGRRFILIEKDLGHWERALFRIRPVP